MKHTDTVMERKVTIKDIAKEAGVSVSLVSFVMNDSPDKEGRYRYRVNQQTRERIKGIAERMGYMPNTFARGLRGGPTLVVGAVLPDISNPFYGEISRRLEGMCAERGYTLLIGSTDENVENMKRIVNSFMSKMVDGFIIVPCEGGESVLEDVTSRKIPCVIIDRRVEGIPAPRILLDNKAVMRDAVSLLYRAKGIREIEMISYSLRVTSIMEREEGYLEVMKNLGLGSFAKVHRVDFHDTQSQTMDIMPSIIQRGTKALVFATNSLTISAIKALTSLGATIQKDIFIVGTDNSDVYDIFRPAIPHIEQPLQEICEKAMGSLFSIMDGTAPQEESEELVKGVMVFPGMKTEESLINDS